MMYDASYVSVVAGCQSTDDVLGMVVVLRVDAADSPIHAHPQAQVQVIKHLGDCPQRQIRNMFSTMPHTCAQHRATKQHNQQMNHNSSRSSTSSSTA